MTRVYKYALPKPDDFVTLELPVGARVLCVQMQGGRPYLWARVDLGVSMEKRRFRLAGTGHDIDERTIGTYVATWQDGPFVWHLFNEPGR